MRWIREIAGALTFALVSLVTLSCITSPIPKSPYPGLSGPILEKTFGIMGPPAPFVITDTVSVAAMIANVCLMGAAVCFIFSFGLAALFGIASATLRRFGGVLLGTSLAATIYRIALVKYAGPATIIAVVVGVIACGLYCYGHRKWIEKKLNVDMDRDGKIGE